MLIDVPCNLCGSTDRRVIYPATVSFSDDDAFSCACTNAGHGEYYQLVECRQCRLQYSSPRPGKEDLEQGYADVTDEMYQSEIDGRIRTFQRNLRDIRRYKDKGSLLDVGCSMGVFLDQARREGWDVRGIEPSAWCVQQGRDMFGLDIRQGTIESLKTHDQQYDVVTLWDVLEHVDDPLDTLKACARIVKPGGMFVFSTVDIGSLYARIMGRRWPWLMKMHIYYFDKTAIRKYLEAAGLELIDMRTYRHTVSLEYLIYKMKSINSLAHRLLGGFQKYILGGRRGYVTIGLGDFVAVYARPRTDSSKN